MSADLLERPTVDWLDVDGRMRALTLHQPWASLVALGVKTIETRSWKPPASAIGQRLAIHAGVRPPTLSAVVGGWVICQGFGGWTMRDRPAPVAAALGSYRPLCLGGVVATCTLLDVVPIVRTLPGQEAAEGPRCLFHGGTSENGASLVLTGPEWVSVEEQRPYGDFTPGRYAWLLDNIVPLAEPIPAAGRQGLWWWKP